MRLLLFSLSFILLSCSLGIQEQREDSLFAKEYFNCEDQIGHYSQCFIQFHTQDCDALRKSRTDTELKKSLTEKVQKTCGFDHLVAFCNFNNMTIHNAIQATFKTHTDTIFNECGIQNQRL